MAKREGGWKWRLNGDMHIQLCTHVVYHQMCILCNGELKETGGITNQCSELEGKSQQVDVRSVRGEEVKGDNIWDGSMV